MKRLFTLILILFCFAEVKGQILWERIEKDTVTYLDRHLKIEVQDSLIFLNGIGTWGYAHEFPTFFACYNLNGALKWQKKGRVVKRGFSISFTKFSDSLLINYGIASPSGKFFFQKIRMDSGDTLWAPQYWPPANSALLASVNLIIRNTNGDFIIGSDGGTVTKLNKNGNVLWSKQFDLNSDGIWLGNVIQNQKGNYIYSGTNLMHHTPQVWETRPVVVELKPNGDTIRSKQFILGPGLHDGSNTGLSEDSQGNYLVTGLSDSVSTNYSINWLTKVDSAFNLQWTYIARGIFKDYSLTRVCELADGSYIILGVSFKDGNYILINISSSGQYLAHKTYQNLFCNGAPALSDWKILPDGTIIVAGICKYGFTYLARVTGFGTPAVLGNSEVIKNTFNYLTEAYPNPANETVTFTYNLP